MRIVHISDLHIWRITLNPFRVAGKRLLGMGNLVLNRARKYRLETLPPLIRRIRQMQPDHLLITGDLTTTSLDEEFQAVREALEPMGASPERMTVIPGNHDRYTRRASRHMTFERHFGDLAPRLSFPWLKQLGNGTAILGLDPCRPNAFSAFGTITAEQLQSAQRLLDAADPPVRRLLVACHYPVALPVGIIENLGHGLRGIRGLQGFLASQGPSLYCHGHIHLMWSFVPQFLPRTLCLDPGPAVKRRRRSGIHASLLEIILDDEDVEVRQHRWRNGLWEVERSFQAANFFDGRAES